MAVSVVEEDTVTPVAVNVPPPPDCGTSETVVAPLTKPMPVIVSTVPEPPEVGLTLATTGVSGE